MASYSSDQDWTDEAEAEQAAVAPRGAAAPSLGVPIVTALLGLLVGVLGTSLWWSLAAPSRLSEAAPAPVSASAPAPSPTVAVIPPATAPVVAPPTPVVAAGAREGDDAAAAPALPAAVPAAAASSPPPLSAEEVMRRKERAFARFYKRPPGCEGNPTGDQLVECGNHYIRARREFDERWRTGTL